MNSFLRFANSETKSAEQFCCEAEIEDATALAVELHQKLQENPELVEEMSSKG